MANPVKIIQKIRDINEDVADFIANGPDTGIQGWVRDRYRDRCNQFANLPGWARALGGPAKHQMNAMCQPYWDDNGWDGPQLPDTFEGGQCPGVLYAVTFQYNSIDTAGNSIEPPTIAVSNAIGPISGIRGDGLPEFQSIIIDSGIGPDIARTGSCSQGCFRNISLLSVARVDGAPDTCGDPPRPDPIPGPNPPPDPGPLPGPEPTDDPRDPTGLPRIPIPPFEDPIYGPVPIEEPEDGPGGGGPPSGGDGLPGDPDAVGPGAGGADGGDPGEDVNFGEPPDGRVWVGCVVEATVDPRYGTIPGTAPGNAVYATVLGNASLIYEGYRGSNVRILSKFTDLYRPVTSVVLTGCRVSGLPGVDLTVRPISAVTCPDDPCGDD